MGVPSLVFLTNCDDKSIWCCRDCGAHFATDNDLISSEFQGKYGPAKLFDIVSNATQYDRHRSSMLTGTFIVDHIKCRQCSIYIGWTYIKSFERSERYKVGKYILEVQRITQSYQIV